MHNAPIPPLDPQGKLILNFEKVHRSKRIQLKYTRYLPRDDPCNRRSGSICRGSFENPSDYESVGSNRVPFSGQPA